MNQKITPFQKIVALTLIIALVAMTISPAFAAEHLMQSNPEVNDQPIGLQVQGYARGIHITGNGEYLSRFVVFAYNDTAATSTTVRGYLYNSTTLLPDSPFSPVDVTAAVTVNPTAPFTAYTFDFEDDVILVNGEGYFIAVIENSTGTGTSRYHKSATGGSGYVSGGDGYGDTWSSSTYSLLYYVYTDDEEGGGAPYTPPGTADVTSWDNLISSFTSFIVPVFIILLPAMLLMFLTRRVDKWLLIIGIVIGVGLGYYFMPQSVPLWLVFLVTIGLIGMAYQSVRGGGSN